MFKYNQVTLIGNVGKDPIFSGSEKSKIPFAMFDIAISNSYRDQKSGEVINKDPDWHKIVCYKNTAEAVKKQKVSKGKQVLIIGKLENADWEDKDGVKHKAYRINAEIVRALDKEIEDEATQEE